MGQASCYIQNIESWHRGLTIFWDIRRIWGMPDPKCFLSLTTPSPARLSQQRPMGRAIDLSGGLGFAGAGRREGDCVQEGGSSVSNTSARSDERVIIYWKLVFWLCYRRIFQKLAPVLMKAKFWNYSFDFEFSICYCWHYFRNIM